jgi:acyl-CoA reductase-like NAD-dependent aldehyde dehydrogenase
MTAQDRVARSRAARSLWAQRTPTQRIAALRPLRHAIATRIDEIIDVISSETGKPPMDALAGDIMVTLEHLRFYERNAARILRPRKIPHSRLFFSGTRFATHLEPHGVILICSPWNYPFQLAVVPMATALFAGNAVLLKCSEHTPRTAELIRSLCSAAGLPEDLVQISHESPEEASALIDAHPDLIFFTGSNRNGRAVAAKAAELMIPTVMELGGKDPALVFESCDLQRAVNGITYGSFSNAGQVCVGTKRIYVQQRIYDDFLRLFLARIDQLRIGTSTESDLGPIRIGSVQQRLRDQLADALARGAILHTPPPTDANPSAPIVLSNVPAGASILLEESFGPIVCIALFTAEAEAVLLANCSHFALAASIWTRDRAQARRVAYQLNCGSCSINDVIRNIGNPHTAFGGNKSSGYGRYHGIEGLHTFSRVKSIMSITRPHKTEVHWFPSNKRTFTRLRAILELRHTPGLRNKFRSLTSLWKQQP